MGFNFVVLKLLLQFVELIIKPLALFIEAICEIRLLHLDVTLELIVLFPKAAKLHRELIDFGVLLQQQLVARLALLVGVIDFCIFDEGGSPFLFSLQELQFLRCVPVLSSKSLMLCIGLSFSLQTLL